MKARLFPRRLVGVITAFFLLPINIVYADTYSDDSTYWRWWYVEQITDEMTDGNGVDAENINDTYNGSTVGEYVYNSTGLTADDVKEYVKNQYDNAVGYVDKSAEQYANMIDDIWNSSVDVATKATYQAQKALRETVDDAGNAVVNVSSSSYWGNVYNDIFNNGAYNDQYEQVGGNNSWAGTNTSGAVTVSYMFLGGYSPDNTAVPSYGTTTILQGTQDCIVTQQQPSDEWYGGHCVFSVSVNGQTGYYIGRDNWGWTESRNITYQYENNVVIVSGECYDDGTPVGSGRMWSYRIIFDSNFTSGGTESIPVLQPKQVGYVIHNGIKYPVYSDPSLNPFTINDDGTVTWNDGTGTEPIFVDPSQLTDDGWLNILENVDNSDSTENPYNPFGRPWNTQDDGSALGGFFGNLVKDIGSVFKGLADTLSRLFNGLVNGILNMLKSLFDIDFNSITMVHLDVNFNFITQIWQKLLEILGVS